MLKALINHFIHFSKFLLFWYCSDVVMMSSFIFCSLTIDTFLCNLPYRKKNSINKSFITVQEWLVISGPTRRSLFWVDLPFTKDDK